MIKFFPLAAASPFVHEKAEDHEQTKIQCENEETKEEEMEQQLRNWQSDEVAKESKG